MRDDDEPPALPAPPPPSAAPAAPAPSEARSRLRRTLHSLRSPFRSGSPFHISAIKRTGSNKSSASDGEAARDDRTMRKKNKKPRADAASDGSGASGASRSNDSSPSVDKKKKEGFVRRLGSLTRRRGEGPAAPAPPEPPPAEPGLASPEMPDSPDSPTSPIAVEHAVATRPFTKAAWKRKSEEPEMEKPIEEPSPENALRRRIAFVTQASMAFSEDQDDGDEGEVGTLQEAVALARARLAPPAAATPTELNHEGADTEEEGFADAMPPYGDLMQPEPAPAAAAEVSPPPPPRSAAMSFEQAADADECYLSVCECCGFSAETAVFFPSQTGSPGSERREHLYKILVIGELGTGKTSIIKRYVHQFFSQHYRATIGVDFALKVLNWDANTVIRLQLWDIAGQERFGNMTRVYYKEAVGAFIVFDVSRTATFDAVVKWKNDLDSKVQLPDGSPIPCILLANKCDQQKEGIVNQPAKMDEYCREKGFAGWFETSAKENINIEEAARSLVNKILLNDKLLHSNDKDGERFSLDHRIANGENNHASSSKSCAC